MKPNCGFTNSELNGVHIDWAKIKYTQLLIVKTQYIRIVTKKKIKTKYFICLIILLLINWKENIFNIFKIPNGM